MTHRTNKRLATRSALGRKQRGVALIIILILCLSLLVIGVRAWLSPAQPVEVTVNGSMKVPGTTGQKLLNLLNNADIPVPSACAGAGTCGLCKVKVTEGGGAPLPTETARLSRSDLEQGERLACQIVVRAPMADQLNNLIYDHNDIREQMIEKAQNHIKFNYEQIYTYNQLL